MTSEDMTRADAEANELGRGAPICERPRTMGEVIGVRETEPMTCPECLGTGYLECPTCEGEGSVDSVESESDA